METDNLYLRIDVVEWQRFALVPWSSLLMQTCEGDFDYEFSN